MPEPQQPRKRGDWEDYYDSIGLSPTERFRRWLQKEGAMRAQTVADVACLIKGSFFEADFETEDGLHRWRCLNPDTLEVTITKDSPDGEGWYVDRTIILSPTARVRHIGSGEDLHRFAFLDPPIEAPPASDEHAPAGPDSSEGTVRRSTGRETPGSEPTTGSRGG